jgi:mannose/fructose-specific phosphotransferase system component IIA
VRKFFEPSQIEKELPGIIILSHGSFAVACVETVRMLAGNQKNIVAFPLEEGEDPVEYAKEFMAVIELFPKGSIIFVDVMGGTPCNALMTGVRAKNLSIYALSGVNIPMILTAISERLEYSGKELLEAILRSNGIHSITAFLEKYTHAASQ